MNTYKIDSPAALLRANAYPGRGIILGALDGLSVAAYFIMGRSENSRNRVFVKSEDGIRTEARDPSKCKDPSLIIYAPVRELEGRLIVTNGDQTDTIRDYLVNGKTFEEALDTREFEPDSPNFTPRISGLISFADGGFSYKLNILKSIDENGSDCCRYTWSYPAKNGLGHFIHTYDADGDPLPTFTGEPERVKISGSIDEFTAALWDSLNADNKISLYVRYTDPKSGKFETRIINKEEKA